jgi:hypothetical protein
MDGVPARPFRVVQGGATSSWSHVMDFAQVEVSSDGSSQSDAGQLRLRKGTRLVVLDIALLGNRVHLLTHTADPLPGLTGEPVFGCTEFVFAVEPAVARAGRAEVLFERIERWLEWTEEERLCAPGIDPICLQP